MKLLIAAWCAVSLAACNSPAPPPEPAPEPEPVAYVCNDGSEVAHPIECCEYGPAQPGCESPPPPQPAPPPEPEPDPIPPTDQPDKPAICQTVPYSAERPGYPCSDDFYGPFFQSCQLWRQACCPDGACEG